MLRLRYQRSCHLGGLLRRGDEVLRSRFDRPPDISEDLLRDAPRVLLLHVVGHVEEQKVRVQDVQDQEEEEVDLQTDVPSVLFPSG